MSEGEEVGMSRVLLDQVHNILSSTEGRTAKAERIAGLIREAGKYRWVGLYEVSSDEIAVIAWSGPRRPALSDNLCYHPVRNDRSYQAPRDRTNSRNHRRGE